VNRRPARGATAAKDKESIVDLRAEPNAAPDRVGIAASRGSTSIPPARRLSEVAGPAETQVW